MKRLPRRGSKAEAKLRDQIRQKHARGYSVGDLVIWFEAPVSFIHDSLGIDRIKRPENIKSRIAIKAQ